MGKNLKGKEIGEGISQRKDGRYSARFRSKSGKRVTKYFDKVSEAKKWLAEAKYEDGHGNIATPNEISVDTWFDYWINNLKANVRYGTRNTYIKYYNNYIKEPLGRMLLSDVKPLHCQNVLNNLDGKLKSSTVRNTRTIMANLFSSAVENRFILSSPMTKSVVFKNTGVDERRVLTVDEQKAFVKYAKKYSYYEQYVFVLNTGLRYGELTGLKWQDVDYANSIITIRRSTNYNKEEKRFVDSPPKTKAGERDIMLTTTAKEMLCRQKDKNNSHPVVMGYQDYIFVNSNGNPVHCNHYNDTLRKIANNIGVDELSMHRLRHTFATRCIESGMNPKTLQKIMGHSKLSITMDLYVHVTNNEMIKEMTRFEEREDYYCF